VPTLSHKIVIIDDSKTVLAQAPATLADAGYEVVTVDSPFAAASVMLKEKPDLVLMDVHMPALPGDKIVSMMRNRDHLQNVRVALQHKLGVSFQFWRSEKVLDALNERALELLDTVGLRDVAEVVTVELPYGRKRALEIATTLAMEPKMMLLDEPTQGMGHEDVELVTQLIKKVAANRTVLMVEHNMNVVASIADTITVDGSSAK